MESHIDLDLTYMRVLTCL